MRYGYPGNDGRLNRVAGDEAAGSLTLVGLGEPVKEGEKT